MKFCFLKLDVISVLYSDSYMHFLHPCKCLFFGFVLLIFGVILSLSILFLHMHCLSEGITYGLTHCMSSPTVWVLMHVSCVTKLCLIYSNLIARNCTALNRKSPPYNVTFCFCHLCDHGNNIICLCVEESTIPPKKKFILLNSLQYWYTHAHMLNVMITVVWSLGSVGRSRPPCLRYCFSAHNTPQETGTAI